MEIDDKTKDLVIEFNNALHDLLSYAGAGKLLRAKYRDHLWEIHEKLILVFEPDSWEAEAIKSREDFKKEKK